MAKRKYAGRSGSRKRRKTSKRSRYRRSRLPISGFPKTKVVKLRYCHTVTITNPAPIHVTDPTSICTTFIANGPDQPWNPLVTHQPKGYDQWNSIYNHWQVLGSKIKVKCTSANDNTAWGVVRVPDAQQMHGMTYPQIVETRFAGEGKSRNPGYSFNTPANLTQVAKFSSKKQFGKNSTNNEELSGTQGTQPSEKTYYDIWQIPTLGAAGGATPKEGAYLVIIDYIMLFTEPRLLAQS